MHMLFRCVNDMVKPKSFLGDGLMGRIQILKLRIEGHKPTVRLKL
jgi:hypothetical protein